MYDTALGDEDVAKLAAGAADLENEYMFGKPGDASMLSSAIAECESFIAASCDTLPNCAMLLPLLRWL